MSAAAIAVPPMPRTLAKLDSRLALAAECWLQVRSDENRQELTSALLEYNAEAARPMATAEQVEEISAVMEHRRAPNTLRLYAGAWGRFQEWLSTQPDGKIPADPFHVAAYLAHLHAEGKSFTTVKMARNAIGAQHREANWPDPTADERVRAIMSGASRDPKRRPHQQVEPINDRAFEQIKRRHNPGQSEDLRAITLIAVMRDGLLRCSEAQRVTWSDFSIAADGSGRLVIQRSKTDQTGAGATVYLRPETVGYLNRWAIAQHHGEAPQPDERLFPFTERTIRRIIVDAAEQAQLFGRYSTHSPRVGMAQDLLDNGASFAAAMQAGRWASERQFLNYVRNTAAGQNAVAKYCV